VLYPLAANWVWNPDGWLAARGFNDFAGSAAVHAMGGFAALAAAMVLGPRIGKYNSDGSSNAIPGHNIPLAAVGAFILWFGWFGFNPGSTLAAVGNWEMIGSVATNTFLASAAGIDITMVINGVLAGLVGITAGCNVVSPNSAILIGLVAGVLVDIAVVLVDKMGIDDPVGAIAVHGINGAWGTLAVGLFAMETGLLTGGGAGQLITQAIGLFAIIAMSFILTFVLMTLLKLTIGIRVSPEDETAGLDAAEYGLESYTEFE